MAPYRGPCASAGLVEPVLGQRDFSALAEHVAYRRNEPVAVSLADMAQIIGQRHLERLGPQCLEPLNVRRRQLVGIERQVSVAPWTARAR